MADTSYKTFPLLMKSKGLLARYALDRPPDASFWLNLNAAFERVEGAMSSRYGSIILNRDPAGVGVNNYLFPYAVKTIARLKYGASTFRYAALSDGSLYRRAGDLQGQFTNIVSLAGSPPAYPLSGNRFTWLVNTCFQSSQPWLFMYDSLSMLKDKGTGTPSRIGILPPQIPVLSQAYAPNLQILQVFNTNPGFTASNLTIGAFGNAFSIAGSGGAAQLSGNYERYVGSSNFAQPPDGMLCSSALADGTWRQKFQTNIITGKFDIFATNNAYTNPDTFNFPQLSTSIAVSTTGSIKLTFAKTDLSAYNPADLIVLAMALSLPQNVQEIRIMFDVGGSGFTSAFYTKTLIPASYQGWLNSPELLNALVAQNNQAFQSQSVRRGVVRGFGTRVRRLGSGNPNIHGVILDGGGGDDGGDDDGGGRGIPPAQFGTGQGSWSVIHLQFGDFLPVGQAGEPGMDWSNITGWQIQVTTNAAGGTSMLLNSIYLQGGGTVGSPVVMASGPSSLSGIGYDFRYSYYNAATGTESNGSREQLFPVTSVNPGGVSDRIVFRQAINVQGQYSADAQVTHVRFWVRGGLYGDNWYLADKIPNVTGTGMFSYKYTLPDSVLAAAPILNLQNDVPVTSTLQSPIQTLLNGNINPNPANTNNPTLVTVLLQDGTTVFVANQIVFIGTPNNLEEVVVVTGGVGTFTCYIQLPHTFGEPVQSFSLPAVNCNMAAIAFGQTWLAGDPNNPHWLYYTPNGYPENCPPQNHIPVGNASDPIIAVMAHRGMLYVSTLSTWFQIFPGNPPYAMPTGSKHGNTSSFGWALAENEVWYQASDGIRAFRGTDGPIRSVMIEWLYRMVNLTPVPLVDLTQLNQALAAYKNNETHLVYIGIDGSPHRLIYNNTFQRWRNDDRPITAMLVEPDTNVLLYSVPMTIGGVSGWAICSDSLTQDWDDGGWVAGQLVKLGIPWTVQTPYYDQGSPHNPKNYNVLEIDCNPNGQSISPLLLFDDNNGNVLPVVPDPPTFTGTVRDKFQFKINAGQGQQAYRASLQLSGSIQGAPELYQANLYAAVLTDMRSSYDTYWDKFDLDEEKIIKQGYFDYITENVNSISVSLYADGDLSSPYYTFTLPANSTRLESPVRVRFGNTLSKGSRMMRLFRLIATSTGGFQLWSPIQVDWKPVNSAKAYTRRSLGATTPV